MYLVTEKAQRPASMNGKCFYCQQQIGTPHKDTCVMIKKKIKLRAIIEYETNTPASWGKDAVEHYYNDGTWCKTNTLDDIQSYAEKEECLCGAIKIECLEVSNDIYLEED